MEIKLNDVSFSYDKKRVIDNFSCVINGNIISAIVGASGCGKSTLLDLIDGLLVCSSGYIKIGECEVSEKIRKKIGYLFAFF